MQEYTVREAAKLLSIEENSLYKKIQRRRKANKTIIHRDQFFVYFFCITGPAATSISIIRVLDEKYLNQLKEYMCDDCRNVVETVQENIEDTAV